MRWPWTYFPASLVKSGTALRGVFGEAFFGNVRTIQTNVDYALARSLYRNDNPDYSLGAGFVRPIIDLTVEYVALPTVTSSDSDKTVWLNECIHEHWAADIAFIMRDSLRDSKTIMRFRQPSLDNPLFTEEDRMHGRIEGLQPEVVELSWNPADPDRLDQAVVHHEIDFDERTQEEITQGNAPRFETHHIIEIVTPERYRFYDETDNRELVSWETANTFGFVPFWPVYNEYATDLGGGQSDIEPAFPFIQAFHEVLLQSLAAHKYHSTPKATFKLNDVTTFLQNNYPEVLDENGRVKSNATINWSGRQVMFFAAEESAEFLQARSVLGDSKTLLEFLIDCIAIAAEVPKWALLKDQGATEKDASVQPFDKKIGRKRKMFSPVFQMACKMALKARGYSPETVKVIWPALRLTDLAARSQSIQQLVMALDTAKMNRWIADDTVIEILASLFEQVNDPATEKRMAADNYEPPVPAPAPASPTQGAQNGNGGGSRSSATAVVRKAVTTTKASNS